MNNPNTHIYADCHVHSSDLHSDGKYPATELVKQADTAKLKYLCITNHDVLLSPEVLQACEDAVDGRVSMLRGVELSCSYTKQDHTTIAIHIIALGCGNDVPHIQKVADFNRSLGNRPYCEAVLEKLKALDLDIGSYEELLKKQPHGRLEKRDIAIELSRQKGIPIDEVYDDYLSKRGRKLAYIQDETPYTPYQEVIEAIQKDGAIATLCHPLGYGLTDFELLQLISDFKKACGEKVAAMETMYKTHTTEQVKDLQALCNQFDLYESVASDLHGNSPMETFNHRFPAAPIDRLLQAHNTQKEWNK